MSNPIAALLQPIKQRLEAANIGPLGISLSANRKWDLLLENPGTADERLVAKCVDDDETVLFMNAPTDQARLIAAVEAVEALVDEFEQSSEGFGLDLQDDDFERGWHGARRETVAMIRAALTSALESAA